MKKKPSLPFDKPKKKKKSLGSLKKKLWKVFSVSRRLDGADKDGYNACISCGNRLHFKQGQAGHYLHGHSKASFLLPENVHFQCVKCNHFLSGNLLEYHSFMLKRYGQSVIDQIKAESKKIWKPSRQELEDLIAKYEKEAKIFCQ